MLRSGHAICSASAPTAEHQRRRPRTADDRAGKQNRQFIAALAQRLRHFSDLFLPPRRLAWPKD
jgi:thiosulfate reductase cytochrome b subunit